MRKTEGAITCGGRLLAPAQNTLVMGIVNVTPNSFSDGGKFFEPSAAIAHALQLVEEGADIIDIGGVSTAPRQAPVDEAEELRRTIPVIAALRQHGVRAIAIDTKRSRVAAEALSAGASWINDQSAALSDPLMREVMGNADAVVLMHNGGGVSSGVDAGEDVRYVDVMKTLTQFFQQRVATLADHGIDQEKIIVDPGIGFGKGLNDSLTIINNMHQLTDFGALTLIGVSRKSFLGKITGLSNPQDRDFASLGATAAAVFSGADIVRTHAVKPCVEMLSVLDRCIASKQS